MFKKVKKIKGGEVATFSKALFLVRCVADAAFCPVPAQTLKRPCAFELKALKVRVVLVQNVLASALPRRRRQLK
ncbi:hypothetical protein BKP57_05170 [Virgibacillus sp. 6R]|nr:hypothetical protein BKP57_05170 [Virgibacillus sp. 6R]